MRFSRKKAQTHKNFCGFYASLWLLLSPGARQALDPTLHLCFRPFDIFRAEPFLKVDSFDWIHRALEVLFISKGKRCVDAHSAFEPCVRSSPFFLACGEAFLWLKSLANAAWNWIQNVRVRFHSCR